MSFSATTEERFSFFQFFLCKSPCFVINNPFTRYANPVLSIFFYNLRFIPILLYFGFIVMYCSSISFTSKDPMNKILSKESWLNFRFLRTFSHMIIFSSSNSSGSQYFCYFSCSFRVIHIEIKNLFYNSRFNFINNKTISSSIMLFFISVWSTGSKIVPLHSLGESTFTSSQHNRISFSFCYCSKNRKHHLATLTIDINSLLFGNKSDIMFLEELHEFKQQSCLAIQSVYFPDKQNINLSFKDIHLETRKSRALMYWSYSRNSFISIHKWFARNPIFICIGLYKSLQYSLLTFQSVAFLGLLFSTYSDIASYSFMLGCMRVIFHSELVSK